METSRQKKSQKKASRQGKTGEGVKAEKWLDKGINEEKVRNEDKVNGRKEKSRAGSTILDFSPCRPW